MSESPQLDNARFATRIPVVDQERAGAFRIDDLDREWNLVTETAKRNIFQNPDARRALIGFTTIPVSESLPASFLSSIGGVDPRVNRISSRYERNLGVFLALPSVPDELLRPDLRSAAFRSDTYPDYGITNEEREMVTRRYRYGRDVKLLALGAEMTEVGSNNLNAQANGSITEYALPSGVRIGVATKDQQITDDLLTPQLWEKRKQIKDRVYEITVNGKRYILKERKTTRHRHTPSKYHDGLTSEEEMTLAQKLNDLNIREGGIKLNWEIPLGFVEFPDGFQFALFEFTDGLNSDSGANEKLAFAILDDKLHFNAEYEQVKQGLKRFTNHPAVKNREKQDRERNPRATHFERLLKLLPSDPRFSDVDYALVKSYRMREIADFLATLVVAGAGYLASDNEVVTKVDPNSPDLLGVFRYDYEHFKRQAPEQRSALIGSLLGNLRQQNEKGITNIIWIPHISLTPDGRTPLIPTKVHEAAYQTLVALEGDKWNELGRKVLEREST